MFTQQMKNDYLRQMFSLAPQCEALVPAQRRYFLRQLAVQHQDPRSEPAISDRMRESTRSME